MAVCMVRHRTVLDLEQRRQLAERAKAGEDMHALAAEFKVHVASVRRIRRNLAKVRRWSRTAPGTVTPRKNMKRGSTPGLEQLLKRWHTRRKARGEAVTGPLLCEQALAINKRIGGPADFRASRGWLSRFKWRHGIKYMAKIGGQVGYASLMWHNSIIFYFFQNGQRLIVHFSP